jgi:hypothetical protein
MTPEDNAQDRELVERYRRASDTLDAAPSDAVRAAILAEGRRAAEQRAAEPARRAFDVSRPPANDSRWKITAFGTAGAALVAALLFAPRLWERRPVVPATSSGAPAAATPRDQSSDEKASAPKLESVAPPSPSVARAAPRAAVPQAGRIASLTAPAPAVLLSAAASGDVAQATALLDQGGAVDARDELGRTPLMLAVMQNRPEVVRLLLDRGADPNSADNSGRTPLQQAKQENLREIAAQLERAGGR